MPDRYSLETLTILINDIRELQRRMDEKLEKIEENTIRHSQNNTYLQGMVLDIIERHEAHIAEEKRIEEMEADERMILLQKEKSKFFIFLKDNEQVMKLVIMVIVAIIVLFRVGVDALTDILKSWLHV